MSDRGHDILPVADRHPRYHSKEINDQHGHDAGNDVLRVLAKVGMSMTDGHSLFARWDGEAFIAALPGADANLAHRVADKLRQRFERQDFSMCGVLGRFRSP